MTAILVTLVNITRNKCVHFDNDEGGGADVNEDDGGGDANDNDGGGDDDDDEGALAGQMGP